MTTLDSKAGLLATIRETREGSEHLVAEAGDRAQQPGATGDWTLKDVLAHLNGWRWRSVGRLEAAAAGSKPVATPWPAELGDEPEGVDAINQWFYEQNRAKPLDEVLGESRETFDRLEAATAALSESDLLTPDRYPWLDGYALADVIGGMAGHFREHESALRAWLRA